MPTDVRLDTGYVATAVLLPDETSPAVRSSISMEIGPRLPGGWRTSSPPPQRPDQRIIVSTTVGAPHVRLDERDHVHIALRGPTLATPTIGYVTYTVAERARQQRGMVTAHAAAVTSADGRAVLLLGDKGAGKSSTVMALLDLGYRFLGDDLVVLADRHDHLDVLAGNQRCAVRQRAARFGYETKALIDLGDTTASTASVVAAVRLSVHPAARAAVTAPAETSLTERLRFAENLARYIAGTPTPLSLEPDVIAPVYPLDMPACAATRAAVIRRIDDIGLRYLNAPTARHAAVLIDELMGT